LLPAQRLPAEPPICRVSLVRLLLGALSICRSSHFEPDDSGSWWADLAPVGGPWMGPYDRRGNALKAKQDWLEANWIGPKS
jgi:hypothetical protein